MKNWWNELNNFFSATTIHGFAYVNKSNKISTRIIWTIVTITTLSISAYLLQQTIKSFDTNFLSTTIETRKTTD